MRVTTPSEPTDISSQVQHPTNNLFSSTNSKSPAAFTSPLFKRDKLNVTPKNGSVNGRLQNQVILLDGKGGKREQGRGYRGSRSLSLGGRGVRGRLHVQNR
jgi:hypothetical protein